MSRRPILTTSAMPWKKNAARASITSLTGARSWISTAFLTTTSLTSTPQSGPWLIWKLPALPMSRLFSISTTPRTTPLSRWSVISIPTKSWSRARKIFVPFPAESAPPKVDLREEPHYGERRESISDPLARLPRLDIAYHVPPGNTADNYAMQEVAVALAQGQSSRFYQHLVKEKQLASNVNIFTDARTGTS